MGDQVAAEIGAKHVGNREQRGRAVVVERRFARQRGDGGDEVCDLGRQERAGDDSAAAVKRHQRRLLVRKTPGREHVGMREDEADVGCDRGYSLAGRLAVDIDQRPHIGAEAREVGGVRLQRSERRSRLGEGEPANQRQRERTASLRVEREEGAVERDAVRHRHKDRRRLMVTSHSPPH